MMLIVRGHEKRKHEAVMERMFRLRYQHFVQRRGWSLPTRNKMEIDQYDVDDAVYFILLANDGSIEGTVRLNQTVRSSLLADLFPFLIETGELPRGEHLYEGSRFIVAPAEQSKKTVCRAKSEVLAALVDWCLDHGGRDVQAVIDASMLSSFLEMTMRTRVLGLAHEYGGGVRESGGGKCIAFRWALSDALVDDLRAYGGSPELPDLAVMHDLPVFQ